MLVDRLLQQKREIERRLQEPYVPRDVPLGRLSRELVNVVSGPRRAGKSFFALHAVRELGRFGYVNFDDERLAVLEDYDELVAAIDSTYGHPEVLLLDEVQNLPSWELFVNRLQRQGVRLTITGSNAHLLGSELATHLTGRYAQLVLFPFSFSEVLRSLGRELTQPETAESLRSYAETGGYPEPLLKGIDRKEYLSTLVRAILYKDIVVRHRIRSPQGLEGLARCLLSSIGQEYSGNRLAKATGIGSVHSVEKYVGYLEEAFLFFTVRRFSWKVREQIRANRKAYATDNGLIASGSFRSSADRGRLLENLAAVALRKRELLGELELYFWKGPRQEEVDFVVKRGSRVAQLIQVCADTADPRTKERETRALLKAAEELGCADLIVACDGPDSEEEVSWYGKKAVVRFVPLWKLLLDWERPAAEGAGAARE